MNIVFICGALEPGRDGVGDYTLSLAVQLIKNGHTANILAVNDTYISVKLEGNQFSGLSQVGYLRVPSIWSDKHRFDLAKRWIHDRDPTWISLQFVPFSFQRKGLPFTLQSSLSRLGQGRKWHIMFHELWVGMPKKASIKHVLWGWVQKEIINALITKLNPSIIHTQCRLYHAQLSRLGIKVRLLPLFSNIPAEPMSLRANGSFDSNETAAGLKTSTNKLNSDNSELISLIMFGTIHPEASVVKFLNQVTTFKQQPHQAELLLTLVGNCGLYQEKWVKACRAAGIRVEVMGEQTGECISLLLARANIGISTTALPVIDKSGTVAAMLAHRLPVICVGQSWQPRGLPAPDLLEGVYVLSDGCIEACLNATSPMPRPFLVSDAAELFIDELNTFDSHEEH